MSEPDQRHSTPPITIVFDRLVTDCDHLRDTPARGPPIPPAET
jgi:hypothetical protein